MIIDNKTIRICGTVHIQCMENGISIYIYKWTFHMQNFCLRWYVQLLCGRFLLLGMWCPDKREWEYCCLLLVMLSSCRCFLMLGTRNSYKINDVACWLIYCCCVVLSCCLERANHKKNTTVLPIVDCYTVLMLLLLVILDAQFKQKTLKWLLVDCYIVVLLLLCVAWDAQHTKKDNAFAC